MSNNASSSGLSIGFPGLLTIVFAIAKLTGHIDWSWVWVFSPIWIVWTLVGLIILVAAAVGVWANK